MVYGKRKGEDILQEKKIQTQHLSQLDMEQLPVTCVYLVRGFCQFCHSHEVRNYSACFPLGPLKQTWLHPNFDFMIQFKPCKNKKCLLRREMYIPHDAVVVVCNVSINEELLIVKHKSTMLIQWSQHILVWLMLRHYKFLHCYFCSSLVMICKGQERTGDLSNVAIWMGIRPEMF